MSSKVIILICLLALLAAAAAADTVTSGYDDGTETWSYEVDMDNTFRYFFRVYLDPNMHIDYLKDFSNSSTWTNPTSLGTDDWFDGEDTITLTFAEWTRSGTATNVTFYYADARDTTVNAPHEMNLINHPGPLLYNPPIHAGAPSTELLSNTYTSYFVQSGDDVPIVPEPTTLGLFGLGLLGLVGAVRRRRAA